MARRKWVERDHPRHPGGSDKGGQFRDRVGSSGWAAKISRAIGSRRGGQDPDPVREAPPAGGGGSDFDSLPDDSIHGAGVKRIVAGDLANNPAQYVDNEEFEFYDPDWGVWGTLRDAFTDDRNSVSYDDGDTPEQYVELEGDGFHTTARLDENVMVRRKRDGGSADADDHLTALGLDADADADRADEQMRRELAAENDAEFGGEAELERGFAQAGRGLSNQEVAAALSPQPRAQLNRLYDELGIDERGSIDDYLGAIEPGGPPLTEQDLDYALVQHVTFGGSPKNLRALKTKLMARGRDGFGRYRFRQSIDAIDSLLDNMER